MALRVPAGPWCHFGAFGKFSTHVYHVDIQDIVELMPGQVCQKDANAA